MVNGIASLYSQNGLLDFLEKAKETEKPKEEIPIQNLEKTDKFEKGKEEVEAPYQKGNHSSCQNGHNPSKCAGLGGSGQCGCKNSLKTNQEKDKTQEAEDKEETKKAESKDKPEGNEELTVDKGKCSCSITLKDESDDPTVTFQTPTEVPVDQSEAKVRAHEQQHVTHETAKAQREGEEVSTTVRIKYETCPECGKRYAVGGETTVTTREKPNDQAKAEGELNEAVVEKAKELTPELEREIVKKKQQRPDITSEELARQLKQQEGVELSSREIEEILKKNNQDEVSQIPSDLKQKILQKIKQNPKMDEEELKRWLKQQENLEVPKEEIKRILDQNSKSFNPAQGLTSKFINPSIFLGQSLDLVA